MKTAILGGGITGVSLARFLSDRGVDWQLFEASERLGGLCRSETVDGFVSDRAGGHIIFSKHREVLDFVLGALGAGNYHESPRKSAIFWRGSYVQYPFENGLADLPKQDNFECLAGYVEADFRRRQGAPEPTNFKDWCLWRFGDGISEKFMFPYNTKLWNVALDELSSRWVSGRIPDAPVEDVLKAAIGIRTEGYRHQAVFWYPLQGGFESIVRAVAAQLDGDRVHVARPVRRLERDGDGWLVDGERFDKVVSTIPLPQLAKLFPSLPDEVARAFAGLGYTSLISMLVAIDAPPRSDRSWIYFPHPETGPFNRLTHISNYSPGNAPEGKSSLMLEITHRGPMPWGEKEEAEVVEHLVACGLMERKELLFTRSWHNEFAYILYAHDLEENLAVVKGWLNDVGIDPLGRFGNYDYFNSDQCIKAAMDYASTFPAR